MKKIKQLCILFIATLCFALCFAFAGCGETTVNQLLSDYGITAEGGGFEKGSSLVTDLIETTGEEGQEIIALLDEQTYAKDGKVSIYDIFVAKDGIEVQPNGKVKITLPAPFESENGYVTFHVKDDDSVETLVTTYAEGKIFFETDSFSYFVVAAANNPSEAKKYTFTATLGGEGQGTIYYLNFPYSTYQNTVSEGTEIKLRATAYGGFAFTGWYVVGEIFDEFVSADEEYTFTVNSDMTVYAKIELTFTFDALVSTGSGNLEVDGENVGGVFRKECVVGTTVKVKAIGDENYEFEGWYTSEATPVLISTDAEYTFTIDGNVQVLARFKEKVKSLSLDGANAGFTEGKATYTIGEANKPTPENVIVSGATVLGSVPFTKDVDYTIDLGGLDFERVGTYTITYTYVKDTTVKATLTVVVEGPNYLLKVGQQGAGGTVSINGGQASSLESNAFSEKFKAKTRITLVAATRTSDYIFLGWYEVDDTVLTHLVLKDTPVSTDATFAFDMPEKAYTVYAVFEAKVTGLILDGANAGFTEGKATYTIGEANKPTPENVIVSGATVLGSVPFTKDVDYTIDLGGLDFEKVGTYTITYTYVKDTNIKETLTIEVVEPKYLFAAYIASGSGSISYNGVEQPNGYQAELTAETKVTLTATPSDGYNFVGWFEPETTDATALVLKETPVSTSATYEFTVPAKEYRVYAVFEAKVTGLILDGANAGFTEGKATYTIGEANKPTPENVIVSGATVLGSVPFTKDVDYTIDLGGLDFEKVGTYTITYTYVKDTNIKETLTIEVVAPKFTFSAVTENTNGSIYYNNEVQPNGYQAELEANTSVTLKAVAKNDYEFVGWYTATDVPEFISASAEYTFVTGNADKYVMARFAAKILYLWSDSSNAGFNDNEKSATVTIGDSVLPDPQAVLIYAGTAEGDVLLAKNEDYTIDLGGLDFSQEGTYTITYRHTKNTSLTTTLTVYVVAVQTPVTINLSYSGTADPVKYNGGRAAYVFKSSILNNGEACDIESLGLFYEWRDHTTKAVVAVAKDDTWDSTSAHYPSPAVPGTYDFVVYKMENEVKTDLLAVTRTIVENQFAVVTDLSSLSEYVCYTFIAKAGDNYYAMSNPFTGNSEREAILVTPDSNGVISLGNNYEYVFRPYDTGKTSSSGLVCYGCRTGNGLNRTGNLVLWGTGGIEYTTSTSADYTVTFVLNADGTITVHAPFCEGTLRLVYDATSGKFMFTAKKAVDDTRTSYPVYLYGEYTEPVVEPKETYEFFGKLSKGYDGNAVSFNVYKEVNICTENGEDVAAVLKNETGRFVWTDAKGNVISVGTPDENGNVTGPSAIGSYRLVFQTLQKGENGMEWVEKAVLHSFEITAPAEVN